MKKAIDLTGVKFGRLFVVEYAGKDKHSHNIWKCVCDCGNTHFASTSDLRRGKISSCGCLKVETNQKIKTTHGDTHNRLYRIYRKMLSRCNCKTDINYNQYGGRGITVCDEWLNDYETFKGWAMANGYADNLTIERINVNGNYEPSNCKWATRKVQANNRRCTVKVEYHGEKISLAEYARITKQKYSTAYYRNKQKGTL